MCVSVKLFGNVLKISLKKLPRTTKKKENGAPGRGVEKEKETRMQGRDGGTARRHRDFKERSVVQAALARSRRPPLGVCLRGGRTALGRR